MLPPCSSINGPGRLGPPRSAEEAAGQRAPLTCLPGGSPTMRVEDLTTPCLHTTLTASGITHIKCLIHFCPTATAFWTLLSVIELEGDVLDAMSGMNHNTLAVGPLILNSTTTVDGVEEVAMAGAGNALWEEDRISLSWLDARSPNSVLFVSFGSIATMSMEQMQEFDCGLEMSGHTFVWVVIRSDLIENMCENKDFERIFSEFVARTRDRALLVSWALQTAVLSHPSVAAFLTHCGWNSTIESVSSGVPMLAWPLRPEHKLPLRHYTGFENRPSIPEPGPGRKYRRAERRKSAETRKVKQIMAPEGADMVVDNIRSNWRNFQKAARKAVAKGGSSQTALTLFVELIQKRTKQWSPPQHS